MIQRTNANPMSKPRFRGSFRSTLTHWQHSMGNFEVTISAMKYNLKQRSESWASNLSRSRQNPIL